MRSYDGDTRLSPESVVDEMLSDREIVGRVFQLLTDAGREGVIVSEVVERLGASACDRVLGLAQRMMRDGCVVGQGPVSLTTRIYWVA